MGVGGSLLYHEQHGNAVTAHTEFSRLLAEHGIFGLIALLILSGMLISAYFYQRNSTTGQALTAAFAAWAGFTMVQSAMRFVAVSLAIGLALVIWQELAHPQKDEDTRLINVNHHPARKRGL